MNAKGHHVKTESKQTPRDTELKQSQNTDSIQFNDFTCQITKKDKYVAQA